MRSAKLTVRTLDAACLVAVVRTVVHLVTLLCSMDTGPITTLEFIRPAGYQSFKTTHSSISHKGLESSVQSLLATYRWHCWSFASSVSKWHRALAASTKATVAAAASATVLPCPVASQITLYVLGKSTLKLIWAELVKTELVQAVKLLRWDKKACRQQTISRGAPLQSSVLCRRPGCFPTRHAELHWIGKGNCFPALLPSEIYILRYISKHVHAKGMGKRHVLTLSAKASVVTTGRTLATQTWSLGY